MCNDLAHFSNFFPVEQITFENCRFKYDGKCRKLSGAYNLSFVIL